MKIENSCGTRRFRRTWNYAARCSRRPNRRLSPIRSRSRSRPFPPQLEGRDILGIAQTGSGKTAAFALPILSKIIALGTKRRPKTARALILAPTRELAVQIDDTIRILAKGAHVSTALVLGGVSRFSQVKKIAPGVDILIATPGRLTDLVRERRRQPLRDHAGWCSTKPTACSTWASSTTSSASPRRPPDRQTALFSATMPPEIAELAQGLLKNPVRVEVAPQGTTAAEITQSVVIARTKQKRQVLSTMLADEAMTSVHRSSRAPSMAPTASPATSSATASRPPSSTATSRRTPARRRSTTSATVRCASWSRPTSRRAASTCPASAMS